MKFCLAIGLFGRIAIAAAAPLTLPVGTTPVQLTLEEDSGLLADFRVDGKPLFDLGLGLTQFERHGVGYQGSGISWPKTERLENIRESARNERFIRLEVTAVHSSDTPAERPFRVEYSIFLSRTTPVVLLRLNSLTNSGQQRFRVDLIGAELGYDPAAVRYEGQNFLFSDRASDWRSILLPLPDRPVSIWERTARAIDISFTAPESYWVMPGTTWPCPPNVPCFAAVFLQDKTAPREQIRAEALALATAFQAEIAADGKK